MTHLPHLIQDLGLILMAAAVVSLVFKRLKQPVVLGYLLAGFMVGPNFHAFPTVRDTASVSIWAEIGVIFMLFGLGLEFSFKKLAEVGKSASITASFEILAMLGIGFLTGQILGWNRMDSLFLGGILSISSTTIIVRAFEELGLKGRGFVSLVFGVLIVEDLIAILLLVLLSSVAATQSLSGAELAWSSLRLAFFLVLWFLLGIYLIPILLRRFKSLMSDETLLIVSIGLCLMMVIVASEVGFSPALGAFVMGSILAETPKGRRIEHILMPVKDLFSAVFFVSVGMMIDFKVLTAQFGVILLVTAITIVGKLVSTTIGALVSGRSPRHSIQTGMSLAQIGEFSFIIATLGTTLGVTSKFLYPIAVAVSAATTFTTPYLIRVSDPVSSWLERRLPEGLRSSLARYEAAMAANADSSALRLLWSEYGMKIILNSVLVVAITLAATKLALPWIGVQLHREGPAHYVACAAVFIVSAPFLWAVFFGGPSHLKSYQVETAERLRRLQIGVFIMRTIVGVTLVAFVVGSFTTILAFSGVVLFAIFGMVALLFSRFSEPVYRAIEERFVSNLTEKERAEVAQKARARTPELAPWNATLARFTLSQSSPLIAKSLQDSGIKESYGVTAAMIERGDRRILAPKRGDLLLPGDVLYLIGTDDQLALVGHVVEAAPQAELPPIEGTFGLTSLTLQARDRFVGRTIRDCGLREEVNSLIVGIERDGRRTLSPDSATVLEAGDLLWLVGDRNLIRALRA